KINFDDNVESNEIMNNQVKEKENHLEGYRKVHKGVYEEVQWKDYKKENNDKSTRQTTKKDDEVPKPLVTVAEVYSAMKIIVCYKEQENSESNLSLKELEFLKKLFKKYNHVNKKSKKQSRITSFFTSQDSYSNDLYLQNFYLQDSYPQDPSQDLYSQDSYPQNSYLMTHIL
ncbi:1087_t:CDS:2, partial [Dentiscutata heterogama]